MPSKIYIDENGNLKDPMFERNEKIKQSLQSSMDILLEEKKQDKRGNKKLGFRMAMQISNALNQYGRMSAQRFTELQGEDMEYLWNSFYALMSYYNLYFEIVPNRQMFLRYCGLNARQYQQLQESAEEEMRSTMVLIEDNLKQDGFSAGENGNADAKAICTRLSAKNDGHSMVSADTEMVAQAVAIESPAECMRQLGNILGKKLIE